jgi:endonuclease/exonuclease/phosphatase (EEP) superfamily protein YafD
MIDLLLKSFSLLIILLTFLPLLKSVKWWIRVFDYPRLQKLVLHLLLIILWVASNNDPSFETWIWVGSLTLSAIYLTYQVWPFTFFGNKMIESVKFDENSGLHVLVANVYQDNNQYHKILNLVQTQDPDIVFLVETNQNWADSLEKLDQIFDYSIKIPQENTYGLLFYSKLPIVRKEIHYLVDPDIPSLELDLELKNGQLITIYAIHPTPPVPGENEESTERDAEILIVGKKSKKNPKPSLVIGDLNDVAWSYTTELFLKISEMADPRRGRGTFNTFHAKIPFLRWPLDHVFLSKHFGLAALEVLPGIGSDHFPIKLKAVLTKSNDTEVLSANGDEKKEARQKISNGRNS